MGDSVGDDLGRLGLFSRGRRRLFDTGEAFLVHGLEVVAPGRIPPIHFLSGLSPNRRGDGAGLDERDTDSPGLQFDAKRVGDRNQCMLRRRIGGHEWHAGAAGDGPHVDDASPTLADQRKKRLCGGDETEQVHFELAPPVGKRQGFDGTGDADPGIVD